MKHFAATIIAALSVGSKAVDLQAQWSAQDRKEVRQDLAAASKRANEARVAIIDAIEDKKRTSS